MQTETGLIHIYCGDGKGKTTAGMGLCLRAAGAGLKVLIYQFMKDNRSGERAALKQIPGITLLDGPENVQFSFRMSEEEKAAQRAKNQAILQEVTGRAVREGTDVLFLDEIIYCIRAGLLDEEALLLFLQNKPAHLEVILTGQDPGRRLCEAADYISWIRKEKHPYDRQVRARYGIEY